MELVEEMVTECPRCGAENPDFAVYCGSCSEGIRELPAPSEQGREEITLADSENGPVRLAPEPNRPITARRRTYTIATYAALVALILLVLGFSLYVYHYERQLDILTDTLPSYEDLRSLFDIAKASMYSRMFGEVAAVLAFILIIQGALSMQYRDSIMLTFGRAALANTRWVLLLALSLACMACACMIIVYEFEPDLDGEGAKIVSRLLQYAPQVAWIFVTLSLLLMANGLRRRA